MPVQTTQQVFDAALQHHQAARLPEAERLYRQILAEQPDHFDSLHHLGVIAHQAGRNNAAVDLIRRAIALVPNSPSAFNNLGVILKEMGQADQAMSVYRQALALRPEYPEAQYNLGILLKDAGQLDEALAAFRHAIALCPTYHDAYNNLGVTLYLQGHLDEAITAYRNAIALKSDFAIAFNNLANALKDAGRLDEAIAAFRRAVAAKSSFPEAHSNLIFVMHCHPDCGAAQISEELCHWNWKYAEPLKDTIRAHANDRSPDRRLRIGYVSPDFRDHVVGRNLLPLFRNHDHRNFEIFCYSHTNYEDTRTREFQRHADGWRKVTGFTDEQIAEIIRQDRIDVLVDLALHTADNRLLIFARKPAPVQVTFAGYPGSTGLNAIDYRLSDPYLDPVRHGSAQAVPHSSLQTPGEDKYVDREQTFRLPDSFWCYDPLDCQDIPVNALPALQTGFVTFGCLNNFCKINDRVLVLWSHVLMRAERSRLLLLAKQGSHRQQTLDRLMQQGIHPDRVEFITIQPRRAHMEVYHLIDIGLDSFPYNGHTTSLDSFWMGIPVVTLFGSSPVSRAGWCQLSNLGLTELAAENADNFVRIAIDLANDLPRLIELRSTLRQRMERSPLMDAPRFARNIEAAYRRMWKKWCENVRAIT